MTDPVDLRILALLQVDGRISNAELARELRMAPSAVFERLRKLEQRGVVAGYQVRLSPKALDLGLTAFVFVRAADAASAPALGRALAELPEAEEVHAVAGEDGLLVKLRARDTEELGRLLRERVAALPKVAGTRTAIVLSTYKEGAPIPLGPLAARPARGEG